MNVILVMYSALCEHRVFNINGVKATYEDFGEKYDRSPEKADPYCCADMRFTSKPPTQEVLDKYKIYKLFRMAFNSTILHFTAKNKNKNK